VFVSALIASSAIACSSCGRSSNVHTPPVSSLSTPSTFLRVQPPVTWDDIAISYDRIRAYQCLYEKEERAISNGERQTIKVSFRKPFDVRLDWLDEGGRMDQSAVYRQGLNNGKVLARGYGLLGSLAGTLRLNPTERLALSDSQHPITELGLGKIIERAKRDAADAHIKVKLVGQESLDSRATYRFEFVATDNEAVAGLPEARKALIWVDRELKLPVKLELYDGSNVLLERHYFKNLRVDVNLPDKTFTL